MPRAKTTPLTPEERAEKNRRNSSHSCGPKSASGKAIVAKNANKHGLRVETIVAATENVEAFRDLSEAWYAAYEPRSPGQIAALDRCVYYTWQFHRIVSAEAAVIDEQVNAADVVWMRDQQAQVAAHRDTLAIDPEAALCGLNETAAGCRWMIGEWTVLKSALDEDGCWYAASHRDRAVRLFGLRPEKTTDEMVNWLSLINLCARDEPDARALAWYLEGANIPDTLRRRMRDGAPGRDERVRELRARVDDELTGSNQRGQKQSKGTSLNIVRGWAKRAGGGFWRRRFIASFITYVSPEFSIQCRQSRMFRMPRS